MILYEAPDGNNNNGAAINVLKMRSTDAAGKIYKLPARSFIVWVVALSYVDANISIDCSAPLPVGDFNIIPWQDFIANEPQTFAPNILIRPATEVKYQGFVADPNFFGDVDIYYITSTI